MARVGTYRWRICALLFLATTINYIDRQVIGVLKPVLQADLGWSELDYADIVFWFQAAYAIGLLTMGRLIDAVGVRWGFTIAVVIWSIAACLHAGARSVAQFTLARFALGIGEAGNFPAALKATSEWFPAKERALSTGLFNAGANVGAIATPLLVPVIVELWGWREAFLFTGILGFFWLILWLSIYRPVTEHPKVTADELAYIQDGKDKEAPSKSFPWLRLASFRQSWAFAAGKFMTDPIWWFLLFWLPDFFSKTYGLDIKSFGVPLVIIYLVADVGSIGGGWLSSRLIAKGLSVNKGRKIAMLVCALCVLPIGFAAFANNLALAIAIIALAAAAHQGWSANLLTLASDVMPQRAVASLVGFGGMAGAIGGMLMAKYAGYVLNSTNDYTIIFVSISTVYLFALLVIHLLSPRLEPVNLDNQRVSP